MGWAGMGDKVGRFSKLRGLQFTAFMMLPTTPPTRHVFVYGTLRAGGSNDITRYRPKPQWVGFASVQGTLYELGSYPGLRLSGNQFVVGEVYLVDAALELELDALESVRPDDSGEYIKRMVDVDMNGHGVACLLYEIHSSHISGRAVIAHGDWLAHARANRI